MLHCLNRRLIKRHGKQNRRAKSLAETDDGFVLHQRIHCMRLIKAQKTPQSQLCKNRNAAAAVVSLSIVPEFWQIGRLSNYLLGTTILRGLRDPRLCSHATFVKGLNAIYIFSSIKSSTITHSPRTGGWTDGPPALNMNCQRRRRGYRESRHAKDEGLRERRRSERVSKLKPRCGG